MLGISRNFRDSHKNLAFPMLSKSFSLKNLYFLVAISFNVSFFDFDITLQLVGPRFRKRYFFKIIKILVIVLLKMKLYVFTFLRWLSRVILNKYFSNLQIHFKPKKNIFQIEIHFPNQKLYFGIGKILFQIDNYILNQQIYF